MIRLLNGQENFPVFKMTTYCMNCVPLKPGVWAITLLQILYGSVRIYFATVTNDKDKGFYVYFHFAISLAAACILMLGLV